MRNLSLIIVSIVSAVIIAVLGIALYVNWNAIKGTIDDSKYYTAQEVQNSYDKGYKDGNKSETELVAEVSYYRTLVDEYEVVVAILNDEISVLNNSILKNNETINSLNAIITDKESQLDKNESYITNLKSQIYTLQRTNTTALNEINYLQSRVQNIQSSIEYYESYIKMLETDSEVVATFEFDGKVFNIQIVEKGSIVSVPTPESNEFMTFNGWTVNGELVDLTTYQVNTNTKFIADVIYNCKVDFIIDGVVVSSISAEKNTCIENLPETPVKDGFDFLGWSIDGVSTIDVSTYEITQDEVFVAMFVQTYKLTVLYNGADGDVQSSVYTFSDVNVISKTDLPSLTRTNCVLSGWKFDNDSSSVTYFTSTENINEDITISARLLTYIGDCSTTATYVLKYSSKQILTKRNVIFTFDEDFSIISATIDGTEAEITSYVLNRAVPYHVISTDNPPSWFVADKFNEIRISISINKVSYSYYIYYDPNDLGWKPQTYLKSVKDTTEDFSTQKYTATNISREGTLSGTYL